MRQEFKDLYEEKDGLEGSLNIVRNGKDGLNARLNGEKFRYVALSSECNVLIIT